MGWFRKRKLIHEDGCRWVVHDETKSNSCTCGLWQTVDERGQFEMGSPPPPVATEIPEPPPVDDDERPYTYGKPGRLDVDGVEWWACSPYPHWYRWEGDVLIVRSMVPHAEWAD